MRDRNKGIEKKVDEIAETRAYATLTMIEGSFSEFLSKKLGEISSWNIDKWKLTQLNKGAKGTTVNRKMDALRASLSQAVKWKLIEKNPLSDVKWCKIDKNKIVRFLSQEESDRLEQALSQRDQRIKDEHRSANQWRADRGYKLLPDVDRVTFPDQFKRRWKRQLYIQRGN